MEAIKIGICGFEGKMGSAIYDLIKENSDKFIFAASLVRNNNEDQLVEFCKNSEVILDFSSPNNIERLAKVAALYKTRVIIGTTGFEQDHFSYLNELSKHVAVLYAANTSLGANLVAILASRAAKLLENYDIEIIEAHHKHKKDAPSGTALMIGKQIAEAKNINFADVAVFDRCAKGVRCDNEIGFASVRGGGIFGNHEVLFAGENEVITIGHQALSRNCFAQGALAAASWIHNKPRGLYSMQDVLSVLI